MGAARTLLTVSIYAGRLCCFSEAILQRTGYKVTSASVLSRSSNRVGWCRAGSRGPVGGCSETSLFLEEDSRSIQHPSDLSGRMPVLP